VGLAVKKRIEARQAGRASMVEPGDRVAEPVRRGGEPVSESLTSGADWE
jgi:hypothetical protein